jgi:integrase/recombinase XerD
MPRRGERSPKTIPGDRSDPLGFPVLVEEFLESMAVRGYSEKTIENRRYNLTYLVLWLGERGVSRPGEVTKPMLDRYQRAVFHHRKPDGQPLSFRSQVQRLTPVRALFKWLARENRILYNPASELELPKAERRLPRAILSQAEAEQVLAVPDLADPLGLRDRAMLELFYATGVRRSELAGLRVFDLDTERLTLAVRQGKGRKDRMIPTGERAAVWIARYLADVRPRLAVEPDDGILFLTVDGTVFSPDRLTGLVADYVKRSGVGKPGACHLFRHTMATLMLEGGADIRFIQQMLGHADISTTQIYTQVSLRQLRAIHAATHPAAQNTPRRQRSTAGGGPVRPVAAFETEVLHLTLASEVRQENARLDTAIDIDENTQAIPPA